MIDRYMTSWLKIGKNSAVYGKAGKADSSISKGRQRYKEKHPIFIDFMKCVIILECNKLAAQL
jgi:hypothetical protein